MTNPAPFAPLNETYRGPGRLTYAMETKTLREWTEEKKMDRRIIRVALPSSHAGITAALRRAFVPAHADSSDSDFDKLLARLG